MMNKTPLSSNALKEAVLSCSGCEACASVCPHGTIEMEADALGFRYPLIRESLCTGCEACFKICPLLQENKLSVQEKGGESGVSYPLTYGGWILDEEVRLASSSGGVFSALAETILEQGGVVYGVSLEGGGIPGFKRVESRAELSSLRGSKYIQAVIGESYKQVRRDLKAGRRVLFSGTICQIGGLKSFLRKDSPLLFTCDVICHGVPSQTFFDKYMDYQREVYEEETVESVAFRDKSLGWLRFSQKIVFAHQKEYARVFPEDLFFKGFLSDVCLRPGCFECVYKKRDKVSELTLGDFWGVDKLYPELFDDKGTSVVFVHNSKGASLLEEIRPRLFLQEVTYQNAVLCNPAYYKSCPKPPKYEAFCADILQLPFAELMSKHYPKISKMRLLARKMQAKIRRGLGRVRARFFPKK